MGMQPNFMNNELRKTFKEKFNYKNDETILEVAQLISEFLPSKGLAIYMYNSWKDSYEISAHVSDHAIPTDQFLVEHLKKTQITSETFSELPTIYNGQHLCKEVTTDVVVMVPLDKSEEFGYLCIILDGFEPSKNDLLQFEVVAQETYNLLSGLGNFSQTKEKANKYELLYRVTQKFHSSINTSDVLGEVVHTLRNVYPQFSCNLFLSQDYQNDAGLPIKELIYNDKFANKSSVQAFLTGNVRIETNTNNTKSRLFAPLKGKQGVYGVLQITAPNILQFPEDDIEFITLLATTAGNALENAHLYQQSQQLISDLQLINETSHTLNSNLRLSETTTFMSKQIKKSFGAEEVGFILFKDNESQILEGSTNYFFGKEASDLLTYIVPSLTERKEPLFIGDFKRNYEKCNTCFCSVMAIPMVQSKQIIGAVIVLHTEAFYFSFEKFKLINSLVHHSTLAFVNSMLREQLESLVITDYLSKLYSRKYLDERLIEHVKLDSQGAFLLIDIDNFKKFNDTYGHDVGDELIIQVASIIKNNIMENAFAARWGGEELAVYIPESTMKEAMVIAENLVRFVATCTKPRITISIGVSHWDEKNREKKKDLAHAIFEEADQALYHAKRTGKNKVVQAD
ncbi:diguanylate cyclase [Aquibacillus koreensis]|uniref:Diguanylate cyclase n=2 Tax=Aquibacillus koreensis TaxID=279446 RepID=A0A9X3WJ39_9BACI|nr:diguanylate cyclase [Aquibacillus koreensis]MCT2534999.1 diguanylate cyclase [Aquibacillus koreensis]MDC3419286.1 diguanylate cyclase [Aquibacillus koreensis]